MRSRMALVIVGFGLLVAAAPVVAHHAFSSEFDAAQPRFRATRTKGERPC